MTSCAQKDNKLDPTRLQNFISIDTVYKIVQREPKYYIILFLLQKKIIIIIFVEYFFDTYVVCLI